MKESGQGNILTPLTTYKSALRKGNSHKIGISFIVKGIINQINVLCSYRFLGRNIKKTTLRKVKFYV